MKTAPPDLSKNIIQEKFQILSNRQIAPKIFRLVIYAPKIAKRALPGQFLNIKVEDSYTPLLRKPLGISRVSLDKKDFGQVAILYKVVGSGTQILSSRKRGEYIDILGPLGNGFDYQQQTTNNKLQVLVGGGIGVAPLLFLAEQLVSASPVGRQSPIVFIGASTKTHILYEKEFKDLGCEVRISTDDGSKGFKGYVSQLLDNFLHTAHSTQHIALYTCGPKFMLQAVSKICTKRGIDCFGLLEEYMACGTGACFGCAVSTRSGFKRVCKDGPVFDLQLIQW